MSNVQISLTKGAIFISAKRKKSKLKTVLKIFLVLLVLIIVIALILAYTQRENIKAAIDSQKYSTEEIADRITQSKQQVQQSIEQYNIPITRDFTVEEEEMIRKGELTVEEAMQNIMSESTDNTQNAAAERSGSGNNNERAVSGAESSSAAPTADSIVANYVTQVYSLKAYYIGQLGALESEMRSVYVNSGRDKSMIPSIVSGYLPQVASLEDECDSKIASLVGNLRSELSAINADTSIADKIYDAYINEKALRKSYYLSQF